MNKLWHDEAWDEKNRIVFRIENGFLEIVECGSHYGDK